MQSCQEFPFRFKGIEYMNYPIASDKFASFQTGKFEKNNYENNKIIYFISFLIPGIEYENNIYWYYENSEMRNISVKF